MTSSKTFFAALSLSVLLLAGVGFLFVWLSDTGGPPSDSGPSRGEVVEKRRGVGNGTTERGTQKVKRLGEPEGEPTPLVERESQQGGRITGTIWLEEEGTPCPGAQVAVLGDGARAYSSVATAGADGRYELSGLVAGKYQLLAWRSGLTMEASSVRTEKCDVKDGETLENVDRILIPGVNVSGLVLSAGLKQAIVGATVQAGRLIATTGGRGQFLLEGLPEGQFLLRSRAEGYASHRTELDVAIGEQPDIVIQLQKGGVVEGVVFDVDGKAAAGAEVTCRARGVYSSEKSDADGRYRLSGVPLSAHEFVITASLRRRFHASVNAPPFEEGKEAMTVNIRLQPGVTVAGKVIDEEDEPVEGAEIFVDWSGSEPMTRTDADGRFRVDGAHNQASKLTARKKGYAPSSVEIQGLAADAREQIELTLGPGHVLAGVVVDEKDEPLQSAWVYVEMRDLHAGP